MTDRYIIWIRIDREQRRMSGVTWLSTYEQALAWASQQFGDRAFEIDRGMKTVHVSDLSRVILNGGQFGLGW